MSLINTVMPKILLTLITAFSMMMAVGCTTTPKAVQESALTPSETVIPASSDNEQVCTTDCEEGEDGVNRYKYYLGILSVFLMG